MMPPGTHLGPYQILGPLGAGGMGEVYRAHDSRLGRDVAIKVLPEHLAATAEVRARFEREARTISQLSHPHICTLYDVGHQDGTDYLVMELLEGETLAHRIEKGALPVAEVLTLGRQIAEALDRAHRAGVVHRDLKPGNVMLTKGGAKLMDFGLARAHGMAAAASAMSQSPTVSRPLTAEGTIVGTFQYMAPEQLEGREADARSDLWALGCVLYEMATGARAFEGGTQASLISAIMRDEPRAMTELRPVTPPALERVVRRCLAKDPDDRFQNARDLAFDLEGVGGSGSSGTATVAGQAHPRRGRRLRFAAAGFLAGAVLVAVIGYAVSRGPRPLDTTKLSFTRLTIQRGYVGDARFGPDDQTIFYSAAWDGRPEEVFETRPGQVVGRALGLPSARLGSVSKDGTLAVILGMRSYLSWGTLAEVPLSGGVPRPILDDVYACDWAPDGKSLAVVHRVGTRVRLEMPIGRTLYETSGFISAVRISRSGDRIAINDHPALGDARGRVLILDPTGRVLARTADEWNSAGQPMWSPDQREVWFNAAQSTSTSELRALGADGRERTVARFPGGNWITDFGAGGRALIYQVASEQGMVGRSATSGGDRDLAWFDGSFPADISRDGRTLLFTEWGAWAGPLYMVCLRGMDGTPPVKLGEGNACALSPDGNWALAIHYGPPQRLILLPTGTGDSTSIPRGPIDTYAGAAWLPGGKTVVFSGAEAGRARRTYVQSLAGGAPRAISPEGVDGWRVSPDGRSVAAISGDQRLHICSVERDSARFVAQLLPEEVLLQWTADGRGLYVARPGISMEVVVVDARTGARRPWREFRVHDPAGVDVFGAAMTPDGRSHAFSYIRRLNRLYLAEGLK